MAARAISKEELGMAVKEYAARHELTMSSNDKGFALMPGDIIVSLADGKPSCSDTAILDSLIDILMDMADEAPKGGNLAVRRGGGITSRSQAGSVPGSATNAAQAIQIMQAGKDLTYTVQKKAAPTLLWPSWPPQTQRSAWKRLMPSSQTKWPLARLGPFARTGT